jgi:hypothetical protein
LETELDKLLNAPSMEAQHAEIGREIEKTITDRMIVMREVVVCASIFRALSKFLNSPLHRK